jgi:protein-L-isoaspartate(D-aspartate) O-methyltransferase
MIDFERARRMMVDNQIRPSSIADRRLLAAMGRVPRERFVPEARRALAYIDEPHQLQPGRNGRALAAAAPFARIVQLAAPRPGDRVLDVGCATGYSSAVLAALAAEIVAIESDPVLAQMARETLAELEISNVTVLDAPLEAGAPAHAPFDVIILEGAVSSVPDALLDQLGDGGRLVALLRRGATSVVHLYVRAGDEVAARPEFDASMPPLIPAATADEFVF